MKYNTQVYTYGGRPVLSQYGFGGFLKKVARAALPLAGSLIGGPVGAKIGGAISSALGPGEKPQQQATQQVQAGMTGVQQGAGGNQPATGITDEALEETMQSHIEQMHARRTNASASLGGGFRFGGPLPMRTGGAMKRLSGTAVEFNGPKHEQGGIRLSSNAEVEGGETMDFIAKKGGSVSRRGVPYIFSDALKVPGSTMSFSKYHKQMVKRGASPEQISSLANRQEKVTGRNGGEDQEEFGFGGFLEGAGRWLGKNGPGIASTAATLAPSLLNIGRGVFSNPQAAQMGTIAPEQIEGPNRSDFGPVQRNALAELGPQRDIRFSNQEAFARNAAGLRTATAGLRGQGGTAARLAALVQNRRDNFGVQDTTTNRAIELNATRSDSLAARRAQLTGNYDLADAQNRGRFAELTQGTRRFNAGERSVAQRFNTQADFNNQIGRQQAEESRFNLIGAGLTGLSNYAQNRTNRGQQRAGNRTAIEVAMAGADPATAARLQRILDKE